MAPTAHHHPIAGLSDGGGISSSILFLLSLHPLTPKCAALAPSPQPVVVQANRPNFAPPVSIIVIILFAIFSIHGLLTLYIRQWTISSERRAAAFEEAEAEGSPSWQRQDGATGLSPEVFVAFPMMTYLEAKALKMGMGALECAVCICEFEDEETLRLLPGCCHVFHPDCIDAWLASHITCPVCRCDLAAAADAVAADADDPGPPPDNDCPAPTVNAENTPPEHVVVVEAEPTSVEDAVGLARNESGERRQLPVVLGRSLSAGHSPQPPREVKDVDRYTLVLPDHVRRQIFAARQFHRSASCAVFPTATVAAAEEEVSSRPGGRNCRGWGSWLGWSTSFLRTLSVTFPPWRRSDSSEGSTKKGEAEGPSTGRFTAVRNSFEWFIGIGANASGGGRGNNNDNTNSAGD